MHRSTFAYPADVQSVARQPTDPNMYWVEHALDGRIVRFHAYADECEDVGRAIDHQGWYCDGDSGYLYGLMRGAVFLLTHGRYVAGYVHGESRRKGFTEVTGLNGATIDLLVNNAGAAAMNALLLTPPAVAADLMRVNYLGTFHCLQAVGKAMVRARRGRILNVTSVAVPLALEGEAAYVASKAAVEALTRVAARELAPQGIVVAAVGLGPVDTRLTRGVGAAQLGRLNRTIGRPAGTTVAEAADFLLRHALDAGLAAGSVHYLAELP